MNHHVHHNQTASQHRSIAALSPPGPVPALIVFSQSVITKMTGNASFPSPTPTLAVVAQATNDLATAETAANARTKGAVSSRNEKKAALLTLLRQLMGYVQSVADANVEQGASIIESASFSVRKTTAHKPRVFDAVQGAVSGSAKLVTATAARRASYEWQSSTDGGKTWVTAPSTLQAKTVITGLTPGASVLFRSRSVTKTGEGDWSQSVTLIVK